MEYPNLDEVELRSKRYWNVDGIPEIVMGCLWIVLGGAFLLRDSLPQASGFAAFYSIILMVILIIAFLSAARIVKILKNRYTYPRGGYMELPESPRSQRLLRGTVGGLIGGATSVMIGLSLKHQTIADLSSPAIGVLFAAATLFASRKPGMRHLIWLSLASIILGVAMYPLKLQWSALYWFFILMGISMAVMGACRFRSFVRSVPLPGGNKS
ncbi:MAG: hypothetical protein JXA73_13820 [Acidobacteria bacterium]|nr:hypothetical protein [Acidobacteriota bacterium]